MSITAKDLIGEDHLLDAISRSGWTVLWKRDGTIAWMLGSLGDAWATRLCGISSVLGGTKSEIRVALRRNLGLACPQTMRSQKQKSKSPRPFKNGGHDSRWNGGGGFIPTAQPKPLPKPKKELPAPAPVDPAAHSPPLSSKE